MKVHLLADLNLVTVLQCKVKKDQLDQPQVFLCNRSQHRPAKNLFMLSASMIKNIQAIHTIKYLVTIFFQPMVLLKATWKKETCLLVI